MRLIAFVAGRPKPQPRVTQNVKFLFSHPVEHWMKVDAENFQKSEQGLLNKKGKPYKPTRYAYRLRRLEKINEYREHVYQTVYKATGGRIPSQNLFFFYMFHTPKSWSKKKKRSVAWTFHVVKPDYTNLLKGIEDALYKEDSDCNAVAHYKLIVPDEYAEGLLILKDDEIHKYVIDTAIEAFITKGTTCLADHNSDKT